jgi:hypothetical protein
MRQERTTPTSRPRRDSGRESLALRLETPAGGPSPDLDEDLLRRIERLLVPAPVITSHAGRH